MLEIYNESIHDLLSADTANKLDIKLKNDGYYVPGLTQVSVSDLDEINTVLCIVTTIHSVLMILNSGFLAGSQKSIYSIN